MGRSKVYQGDIRERHKEAQRQLRERQKAERKAYLEAHPIQVYINSEEPKPVTEYKGAIKDTENISRTLMKECGCYPKQDKATGIEILYRRRKQEDPRGLDNALEAPIKTPEATLEVHKGCGSCIKREWCSFSLNSPLSILHSPINLSSPLFPSLSPITRLTSFELGRLG